MMRKLLYFIIAAVIAASCLACGFCLVGCDTNDLSENDYVVNPNLDTSKPVSLILSMPYSSWVEMDYVISEFNKIYPNCKVTFEHIEDYYKNLPTRLLLDEQKIDIMLTDNIIETTSYKDCALNLISDSSAKILDLSACNQGLVKNYRYTSAENAQYCVPIGGETRGLWVNLTLLKKYGLSVPENRTELLNCCQVLHDAGYIPFQSGIGSFAQQLLYPYICNSIVNGGNYEEMYNKIENIDEGISEYFYDAFAFLYDIVDKGYYDYKRVETELKYKFLSADDKAREFLNIIKQSDETYEKQDDEGKIAFMPDTLAFTTYMDTAKKEYNSAIEYAFISAPVSDEGGYAYLSPSTGLAINKNSDNVSWALEFLNFVFSPKINTEFNRLLHRIPNTKDAMMEYDTPADHVCSVGDVTFSYNLYRTITPLMMEGYSDSYAAVNSNYISVYPDEIYYYKADDEYLEADLQYRTDNPDATLYRKVEAMIGISKMNAPKYVKKNEDGTTEPMFTLQQYMDRLELELQRAKALRDGK